MTQGLRARLLAKATAVLIAPLALAACDEKVPEGQAPSRFAGVTRTAKQAQEGRFCDKSFGEGGGPAYGEAPLRPLAGAPERAPSQGWRWINAWATWCTPCTEEMGLLNRWKEALARDGVKLGFELLSIDEPAAEPALKGWLGRTLPGPVQWIRSEQAFASWLDGLGVDRGAAIPIHVLVDPAGKLRCIRVGAVHEQDYANVRALLSKP